MEHSKEWELSTQERVFFGKEFIKKYEQKVKEYSSKKCLQTFAIASTIALGSLCMAAGATVAVCFSPAWTLPVSINLIIGFAMLSAAIVAASTLGSLIGEKLGGVGLQNPKDWKKEILAQEASKKESYSKKTLEINV